MNYSEIIFALHGLNTEELIRLNRELVETIKNRNTAESRAARRTLRPGQKVAINIDGYRHGNYSVVEIRQVKALVRDEATGNRLTVPMNLLLPV